MWGGYGWSAQCTGAIGFFERVVIVERDVVPADPVARKGVPQSHQIHVLLSGGFNLLTESGTAARSVDGGCD